MSDLRMYEFDAITGEGIYRDLTAEELKEHKANEKLRASILAEAETKEAAKAAILDRIGLTADELKTILG
jgi:hypothetical protein